MVEYLLVKCIISRTFVYLFVYFKLYVHRYRYRNVTKEAHKGKKVK